MGKFGTLNVLEDLATVNDPVAGNEEEIARRFAEAFAIHNALFEDMASALASFTDKPLLPYGGADVAIIQELDEWGAADASKASGFGNLGLPLRIFGGTSQWTSTYFQMTSVAQLATQADAFASADIQSFYANVRRALFKNTNTTDYFDRLQSKLTYDLKALLNADGQVIPPGPSGQSFDGSTHTHYLANATLTADYLTGLVDTVVEHGVSGEVRLYIARADETTVRNLTGFSQYLDGRITVVGAAQVGNRSLDVTNPDDRAIGVFAGAEVWVKPWVPANYQAVVDFNGSDKPLAIRTRTGSLSGLGAFAIRAEHQHYPLEADHYGREYGVGIVGRHKAAVGRSNNASYAIPTL